MQKNTLISEFADKTVRAVSANYWRKSPKTHPNWNDHEYHSVIGSEHTGINSLFYSCEIKRSGRRNYRGKRKFTSGLLVNSQESRRRDTVFVVFLGNSQSCSVNLFFPFHIWINLATFHPLNYLLPQFSPRWLRAATPDVHCMPRHKLRGFTSERI